MKQLENYSKQRQNSGPYIDPFRPDATQADVVLKDSFLIREGSELIGMAVESRQKDNFLIYVRMGVHQGSENLEESIREQFYIIEALKTDPQLRMKVKERAKELMDRHDLHTGLSTVRAFGVLNDKGSEGKVFCPRCEAKAIEAAREGFGQRLLTTLDNKIVKGTCCCGCGALWLDAGYWESEKEGFNQDQAREQMKLRLKQAEVDKTNEYILKQTNEDKHKRIQGESKCLPDITVR